MLLLKTRAETLPGVLGNAKHASFTRPNADPGDPILIAQTKSTLEPGQKSIRHVMTFVACYEDINNESDRIWGKHWTYIIEGRDVRVIKPFNLEDIQISDHNYDPIVTHGRLKDEDEAAVLAYLSS